ncbi:ribonuclease P protein subunit p29 [Tribolium castaneum]|uniref:Ribonuclease P protein subunit p29 n=1 Tax=Tribolium castaneum TaxID=7070 RepID=A0A139WGK6_TRICA|nr:PREDICTED: ribonuclease P protein subunit p29 [Tribolium castaneum]KYB27036.1 Ribonuclease P protein subunit p29-like protein [Tribolium castaneum]|eukprot:XP_969337.1 PREDICTED: ribonuclease P protein subunit p29 [Tribolium castaneum]
MADLYTSLPDQYLKNAPEIGDPTTYIQKLLLKELPRSDSQQLRHDLKWQFLLDKHQSSQKRKKPIRKKKTFLTRRERKDLNILKLPKSDWDYNSLEGIRKMWRQYMRQNLELAGRAPHCSEQDWANFSAVLAKSELIGSEIKVARSKCPSHVGLTGTVVLETKMTFQIVTQQSQLKIIPKNTSVFEFVLDAMKFTVFGKHIMTKPSERSVKKIKSVMLPDL